MIGMIVGFIVTATAMIYASLTLLADEMKRHKDFA